MTLVAGSRLGPYEIGAPLGAGGMGEVYRARDTRLGREVAIKVLPEGFAADRDRLSRFEQEARSASGLNHPNIVTIYEVGRSGSVSFIAMELVRGRTLRDLIAGGALPTKTVLAIGAQITDALAGAHEAGIVHRDLKPENLMVTREGLVKVLDFGLAKLALPDSGGASAVPTLVKTETRPGAVLGTVGYMSPEQASGSPVDFRSDQFVVGSILYEMATGSRAFARATAAETLAAIIREEPPPVLSLAPGIPPPVRWVIERCLAKDPQERYAATRDLARDLSQLRDHASEISAEPAPVVLARRLGWLGPALIAGVLLVAGVAVLLVLRGRRSPPARPIQFAVQIPPGTTYSPAEISRGFALSPDGTRLVIEAIEKGKRHLFLQPLDSERTVELEGTAGAEAPFWSPDSRSIAFFADGTLKRIPAEGGPPEELCPASFDLVGSWDRQGTILFSQMSSPPGVYRVSDRGGETSAVTLADTSRGEVAHIWPHFLPDGRRFLYLASIPTGRGEGPRELRVASLDSKGQSVVARMDSMAEYASPGYLLYMRDGALFAQRFDPSSARLRGDPRLVADGVDYFYGPGRASFSVSQTGVLAYQTAAALSRFLWLDRAGRKVGTLGQPGVWNGFRISADGRRVAAAIEDRRIGTSDVWIFELPGGVATRLNADPVDEKRPVWTPDGSRLLYRSDRMGVPDIYQIAPGVVGSEKRLLARPGVQQPEDVTADGKLLVFGNDLQTTRPSIWLLPLRSEAEPHPWLQTPFALRSPRFSPDGRWIAYESDESGESEIYLARAEGDGEKSRISPAGGRLPRWRRDGREMYYVGPDDSVMAVPITPGSRLRAGAPVLLFHLETAVENFDVTPDGSRFLVSTPSEPVRASPIRLIVNWPALLGK
jgi:Tol biopolymer transport system component